MHNISCRRYNLIYSIKSKTCCKKYAGQTLRRIKDRIYEPLRDIDQANKEKPLGLHFLSMKHEKNDIEVHMLEFILKSPKKATGFDNKKQGGEQIYTSTQNTCTPWIEPSRLATHRDMLPPCSNILNIRLGCSPQLEVHTINPTHQINSNYITFGFVSP